MFFYSKLCALKAIISVKPTVYEHANFYVYDHVNKCKT